MNSINKSIGLVLVMALMLVPATGFAEHDSFRKMGVVPPKTSQPAPDFVAKNLKGQRVKLSNFKG